MTNQHLKNLFIIQDDNKPMYEDMFHLACAYNKSAKLLIDHSEKVKQVEFMFPSIVCQSFAIELLLKVFIFIDHPNISCRDDLKGLNLNFGEKGKNGHAYNVLWSLIKPDYQTLISQHYRNALNGKDSVASFSAALDTIDPNAFTNWRYIHEGSGHKFMHHELTELVSDVLISAAYYGVMKDC